LEYKSQFPESEITSIVKVGHLMMFRYEAVTANKRAYDRNPLCYIVIDEDEIFYGMNLHYYKPSDRLAIVEMLRETEQSDNQNWESFFFGSKGFHKYLKNEVESNFIDIAPTEWGKAVELPAAEFVRSFRGTEMPVNPRSIW